MISFLRQIVEHGGFYRASDQAWVTMERIQFVGACNPPTDPGRKPLSHRLVTLSFYSWKFGIVLRIGNCIGIGIYYIDTDEIPGFLLLVKNHIFTARSEHIIFIFRM